MTLTISCIWDTIVSRNFQTLRTLGTCCCIVTFITTQETFLLAGKTTINFLQFVPIFTLGTLSTKACLTTSGTSHTSIAKELESILTTQTLSYVLRITATTATSKTFYAFSVCL